jgi:hypothetical protein
MMPARDDREAQMQAIAESFGMTEAPERVEKGLEKNALFVSSRKAFSPLFSWGSTREAFA